MSDPRYTMRGTPQFCRHCGSALGGYEGRGRPRSSCDNCKAELERQKSRRKRSRAAHRRAAAASVEARA